MRPDNSRQEDHGTYWPRPILQGTIRDLQNAFLPGNTLPGHVTVLIALPMIFFT